MKTLKIEFNFEEPQGVQLTNQELDLAIRLTVGYFQMCLQQFYEMKPKPQPAKPPADANKNLN